MKWPIETKPAFWGFVVGAFTIGILGFAVAGWMTTAQSRERGTAQAKAAVAAALAPICADRFRHESGYATNLVALKKVESWSQAAFIEKGGWATWPGSSEPTPDTASACVALLMAG